MKPIRLEFSGIKSYVDKTVVDFENLSKGGLFGIFGATGSGKSTILDCIFLSLYGRLKNTAHQSDYLNKKVDFGYVDFTFDIIEDGQYHRYNVVRQFKSAEGKKTIPTPKVFVSEIIDGEKYPRAEKVDSCNEFMIQTIGLNIDDFSKCIVLPQGEFSSFVLQKRSERLSMMAGLFNLSKYGYGLIDRLKDKESILSKEIVKLQTEKTLLGDVSNDALDSAKTLLKNSQKEHDEKIVKKTKIEEELKEYEKNYETHNLLLKAREDKEKLEALKEVIQDKKYVLDNFELAKKIVENYKKTLLRKEEISALEEEIKKSQQVCSALLNEEEILSSKEGEINQKKIDLENKKNSLSVLNSLKVDFLELSKIDSLIQSKLSLYKEKVGELKLLEEGLIKLEEDKEKIEKEIEDFNFNSKIKFFIDALSAKDTNEFIKEEKDFLSSLSAYLSSEGKEKTNFRQEELEKMLKCVGEVDYSRLKEILAVNDELFSKISLVKENILKETAKISAIKSQIDNILEEGKKERARQTQILEKLNSFTFGLGFEEAVSFLQKEIAQINAEIKSFDDKMRELITKKDNAKLSVKLLEAKLETALKELEKEEREYEKSLHLTLDEANRVFSFSKEIATISAQVNNFEKEYSRTSLDIERLEKDYKEQEYSLENLEKRRENLSLISNEIDLLKENIYKYKDIIEKLWKNLDKSAIIEKALESVNSKLDVVEKLKSLLKSSALVDFVAEEYLQFISIDANELLLKFTFGKFGLKYQSNFVVVDNTQGGEIRRVETSSGGELFLVSLSLALALSKSIYARNNRPIEFFFLDEGFGSLDSNLLEGVVEILDNLSKVEKVSIGVISHVEALKERITSKISVISATENSGSKIVKY